MQGLLTCTSQQSCAWNPLEPRAGQSFSLLSPQKADNTPKSPITHSPTQALPHRRGMTWMVARMVCDLRARGLS